MIIVEQMAAGREALRNALVHLARGLPLRPVGERIVLGSKKRMGSGQQDQSREGKSFHFWPPVGE